MADTEAETYRPPPRSLLALEGARALGDLGLLAACRPMLAATPRGDGHPVLVLPGFIADDDSTETLRRFLGRLGYDVHGWGLGSNVGPTEAIRSGMAGLVADLHRRSGQRVSLVGWSLGGVYARELARQAPHAVRLVVTMGSPFRDTTGSGSHASTLYRAIRQQPRPRRPPEHERPRLLVPATAVFSRTDGVAAWQSCCDLPGPLAENVEVVASHCGLGHHPAVLHVVADRLAQPEGQWRPFQPRGLWTALFPTTQRRSA